MLYIPKGQRINWMKDYAVRRPEILRTQMVTYFNLAGATAEVTVIQPVGGEIWVNSLKHSASWTGKYLENLPIEIEAIPSKGYEFVKWKGGKFPKSNQGNVLPINAKKSERYLEKSRIDTYIILTKVAHSVNLCR